MTDTEALPEVPAYLAKAEWWKPEENYAPVTRLGHEIGYYGYLQPEAVIMHVLTAKLDGKEDELKIDQFVPISGPYPNNVCHVCGERVQLEVNFATKQYRAVGEPCKYPDGVPCVVRLEVPSGIIVAENDFRGFLFKDREDDPTEDLNVNYSIDMVRTTEVYAEQCKMIQAFVGNTSPGIYQLDPRTLHVSNSGWIEETDEEIEPPGEHVGSICTDLWWYSMMDLDEFKRRGGEEYFKAREASVWTRPVYINVEPGTYEFTHYACLKSFDRDSPGVTRWTDIKLVE